MSEQSTSIVREPDHSEAATISPAPSSPAEQASLPALPSDPAITVAPAPPSQTSDDSRAPAGYAIERELGRGGMGVVYQARSLALQRICALKMILSGAHSGDAEIERFKTEAQAIARLQHPGIVQVFEIDAFTPQASNCSLALSLATRLSNRLSHRFLERVARSIAVAMSRHAPRSSSSWTTSLCPCHAAAWSGVSPLS